VGLALLVQYICLRFLGLNTVTAYQRAKVYGLKIMNRGLNRGTNLDTDCFIPAPATSHLTNRPSIVINAQSHL